MKEFIEFYEKVKSNKTHIITIDSVKFIVREITWKEGLLIDAKSFRKKDNIVYQNSEFEKRVENWGENELNEIALTMSRYYPTFNIDLKSENTEKIIEKSIVIIVELLEIIKNIKA
jgi:hypothetical protein